MTTETNKQETKREKANGNVAQPLKVFRRGAIAASVWPRQTSTGYRYLEFSLSRSWKTKSGDKEGYSQNYFESNEDALFEVIQEASEFIRITTIDRKPTDQQDSIQDSKDEVSSAA